MPDGQDGHPIDWEQFEDWLDKQFGFFAHLGVSGENKQAWYDYWTAIGKPSNKVALPERTLTLPQAKPEEISGLPEGVTEDQLDLYWYNWMTFQYGQTVADEYWANQDKPEYQAKVNELALYYIKNIYPNEKQYWDYIEKVYSSSYVSKLKSQYTPYSGAILESGIDEIWAKEQRERQQRQKTIEETQGAAISLAPYARTGMTDLDMWRWQMTQSFPEGFGGYVAGTAGFFNALGERDVIARIEKAGGIAETAQERLEREAREREERERYVPWGGAGVAAPARVTMPEYGRGLEQLRTEFAGEVPQTETWRDWYRSMYPRIIEQFEAALPSGLGTAQIEKSWADYLKSVRPQIKERWYGLSPYQRGERPSYYQPRIQTVRFGG